MTLGDRARREIEAQRQAEAAELQKGQGRYRAEEDSRAQHYAAAIVEYLKSWTTAMGGSVNRIDAPVYVPAHDEEYPYGDGMKTEWVKPKTRASFCVDGIDFVAEGSPADTFSVRLQVLYPEPSSYDNDLRECRESYWGSLISIETLSDLGKALEAYETQKKCKDCRARADGFKALTSKRRRWGR